MSVHHTQTLAEFPQRDSPTHRQCSLHTQVMRGSIVLQCYTILVVGGHVEGNAPVGAQDGDIMKF